MTLFAQPSETPITGGLVCAHGEPWMGPHPLCQARLARDTLAFYEAVARGEYDAEGFTPKERLAQAKRARR